MARRVGVRVLWLVSLTQRLSRCLWTMVRPSRRRAPFGLQGGLIPLLVRADRRVMRAHTMENLQPQVCNILGSCKSSPSSSRVSFVTADVGNSFGSPSGRTSHVTPCNALKRSNKFLLVVTNFFLFAACYPVGRSSYVHHGCRWCLPLDGCRESRRINIRSGERCRGRCSGCRETLS